MKKTLIIFCSIFLLSIIMIAGFVSAVDPPIIPPPPEEEEEEDPCEGVSCGSPPSCPSWSEYQCDGSSCDGNILTREQVGEAVCGGTDECGCCDSWDCEYAPTPWTPEGTEGGQWQSCRDDGDLETKPYFSCEKDCLETPENDRYYNNPTYSDELDKDIGNSNVFLPAKLDWNDVEGWGELDGPQSYIIKLSTTTEIVNDIINASEYNVLKKNGSCFLQSTSTYNWSAQACCTIDGQNCGSESSWNFKTSNAPELLSPYDEDWHGPENIGGTIIEEGTTTLKWCKIEDPNVYRETTIGDEKVNRPLSYKALLYHSEDDLCYEQLYSTKECPPIILAPDFSRKELLPPDEFLDTYNFFFTKNTPYAWKIAACKDTYGEDCTDYSQLWRFETGEWKLNVFLNNPADDAETPISLPIALAWDSSGANSYNYKLYGVATGTTQEKNITFNDTQLSLDTVYRWSIQPCSDYESEECEDLWGGPWYFKTTGGKPNLISPTGNDVSIPTKFDWQEVGGAKSYILKMSGDGLNKEIPTEKTTISLDYPDLRQEVSYTWQVKTCAKTGGKVCGNYSDPQTFKTFKLGVPQISYPKNNESFFTYQKSHILDWEQTEGGNFYEYEVNFTNVSDKETSQNCKSENIVPQEITENTNSVFLKLTCLGDYQWKIRSCLDKDCQEASDWGNYNFSFIQGEEPSGTGGIVPCGRTEDDAKTPWNEREDCQINHIFLLIRNIVDFILWTFAPLALGILVLGTGLMFYFSIRFQDSLFLTRIKLIWKAAGIGYGILFLSWVILNLFLGIIGFQIGIFGNWWQAGF
ncbi:MAG: pilin [Candidatus Nealsonbacteria bacterium]